MDKYTDILEQDYYYHLYNHAVGNDLLFYKEYNYNYFLDKFYEYLHPYIEFYAYCLLPNHFHFLVRVKDRHGMSDKSSELNLSEAFRRLFITYSKAINKQENRKGALFTRPFKRIKITEEKYLITLVYYIHLNPVHHNITDHFENYKWSSYKAIISDTNTKLNKEVVLDWFEDKNNFIFVHKTKKDFELIKRLIAEE